ncbi:pyridoxamine 5'-phosphate oxidase [Agarilytica rhodophyticola]|uniref:pyridoxamine 5'-phosphate oxidase n=1 Tax=Agarilytica rhodophyticola TaxID=1737490 RepID=UPI000B3411BE|nr:pyridoxamine 5'-phosphate oxidase [Agarilytica rhodophyticola]
MELEDIRREYLKDGLTRESLESDPFKQFEKWMQQTIASKIPDPTAMTLATVDAEGQPSQRIVLLKHLDERGFVFYTNYSSNKAQDIAANSKVSLHFPWHMMERQVKVLGYAQKVPVSESLQYFASRPRDSQLAAWASQQSHKISSRQFLMSQYLSMKEKFKQGDVPLPDFWGGYRIIANQFEFWQGGSNRLHDRFSYVRQEQQWSITRLAP